MTPQFSEDDWPIVVVGAGAAGLLAAIHASRQGRRALVLETRPVPGAKIRVSGGGRCNLLPSRVELSNYHTSGSPNALRNILFSWPLGEVRAFFERDLGLPLKEESTGKVFPAADRAMAVVHALLGECRRTGVALAGGCRVERISREGTGPFRVELAPRKSGGPSTVRTHRLILATGGLSLPKTGSDGHGLSMAASLGHSVVETHPALVPLLSSDPAWGELAGISLRARLKSVKDGALLEERDGDLLFTHRGFSGPAVLDLSRHFTVPGGERPELHAGWGCCTAADWERLLLSPARKSVAGALRDHLPRRLVDRLMALAHVPQERRSSELSRLERTRLNGFLTSCPLPVKGDEGYGVAEVTAGGIPLEEIFPRTLESRLVPGLHLAGEMLDVVGHIGGYNFLWAWVTGRKAGLAAAEARPLAY